MNELKPEDVMMALEAWIYDFNGTSTQFCALCDAIALLREYKVKIEFLEEAKNQADKRTRELFNENMVLSGEVERLTVDNAEKDAEIERLTEIINKTEDDFPNCRISGCEAARKDCHIDCPYGKEIEGLKKLHTFCENTCKPFQKKFVKIRCNEVIDEFEEKVLALLECGYTMFELAEQIREIASEIRVEGA